MRASRPEERLRQLAVPPGIQVRLNVRLAAPRCVRPYDQRYLQITTSGLALDHTLIFHAWWCYPKHDD